MNATDLIQQAMVQRGMGAPATVSASPSLVQSPVPTQSSSMQSPQPPMSALLGQPTTPQAQPKGQEDIIVQALIKQLERIDKLRQMGV